MTGHLPDALDTFRQNKQIIRKNELNDYGQGKIMVRTVNCNLCMNDTLHWHSEIELLHILTPDVKLYIEGEITPVDMGDSIAILPGALHDTFCPEGGSVLVIQFPPDGDRVVSEYLTLFRSAHGSDERYCRRFSAQSEYGHEIASLCSVLRREFGANESGSERLISGAITQLRGYIERAASVSSDTRAWDLYPIISYIDDNARRGITLAEAAAMAGYSESYFSSRFKSVVGSSFREYLLWVRMRMALRILLDGSLNVSEVAELFGYDNVQNFARAFKKVNRMSPGKVKRG